MKKYMDMSLEELRLLGNKELNELADKIMIMFSTIDEVKDEETTDWIEQLEELYTRIDYVLGIDYI
ncbi:MAG: hypothetical protein II309_00475 [Bacilli bacterium]|nr:hypothetical protein [Bacilli bacterium]